MPSHAESAACLFEFRGGIEAYCAAAAPRMAPGGRFVVCEAYAECDRVPPAATAAGLVIRSRLNVVPKAVRAIVRVRARALRQRRRARAPVSNAACAAGPQGKAVLFSVFEMARGADVTGAGGRGTDAEDAASRTITVRGADGLRTAEYAALLADLGKPS